MMPATNALSAPLVMVGLGPTIHEFACGDSLCIGKLVDARAKPWHDEEGINRGSWARS